MEWMHVPGRCAILGRSVYGKVKMSKALKASVMLGIAGCSYGMYLTVIKLANNAGYMREDLMAGQYLIGALVLGVMTFTRYRAKLTLKQVAKLMVVGFFAFACGVCMYENVALTSTSFAVTMMFQYVWIGILFECLMTRKLPSKQIVIATLLVIAGTPFAAGLMSADSEVNAAGVLWGLGAAVFYAGMLWCSARFETQVPAIPRTFWASVGQTLFASLAGPRFYTTAVADPGVFVYVVPLALVAVIIPCLLIMKYSPLVPIGITNIMTGFELPAVVVFGAAILGESHGALTIFGVAVICIGIVVANWEGIKELRKASGPVRVSGHE